MEDVHSVVRVSLLSSRRLFQVEHILYECGKYMAEKEDLHHWDNSHIKNMLIVIYCFLKNQVYLVYEGNTAVATFQTKVIGDKLCFQKLATMPNKQGCGLGAFCLHEMENIAIQNSCSSLNCEVYEKSSHAVNFYEHHDFKISGKKQTLRYTELVMVRSLKK